MAKRTVEQVKQVGGGPFVPEFETGVLVYDSITGYTTTVNSQYFATERTALAMAERYGDGAIYEMPFPVSGPYYATKNMRVIKFTPEYPGFGDPVVPRMVNAGMLAAYYLRNPEDEFPGLADKLIRSQLKSGV